MKPFKILSRELAFDCPWSPIEKQMVELPSGKVTDWYVNLLGPSVLMIPMKKSGEILLQKNYKHGCQTVITEIPAGLVDEGESSEQAAARELREETGLHAESLEYLGEMFSNPTGSKMIYHVFLAKNCEEKFDTALEPEEQIEPFWVKNIDEAMELLFQSPTSAGAIAAMAMAKSHLEKPPQSPFTRGLN